MKSLTIGLLILLLSACTDEQLYRAIGSPDPQGPPVRYPLDFPLCHSVGKGTIVAPLRISIQSAALPDHMQVMSLRKRQPNANGCFPELDELRRQRVSVIEKDTINGDAENYGGWMALDQSGYGYFSASSYKNQLLNAKDLQEEKLKEEEIARYDAVNFAKYGHVSADVVKQDEVVTINGLVWRHQLIARYDTTDLDHPELGKLTSWDETYEHAVDSSHVLRRNGWYSAMVIADPEWIAARRNLLLKLVQAVRIEPMTQEEVDVAVSQYRQQVEQDNRDWERKH
jgi:hypothetical protein